MYHRVRQRSLSISLTAFAFTLTLDTGLRQVRVSLEVTPTSPLTIFAPPTPLVNAELHSDSTPTIDLRKPAVGVATTSNYLGWGSVYAEKDHNAGQEALWEAYTL